MFFVNSGIIKHMNRTRYTIAIVLVVGILIWSGCAFDQWAVDQVVNVLSGAGGASVFTGEDDPELVGDALPFAIKMYEALLDVGPDNPKLLLTTGQAVSMYAFAFVQTPADMLPDTEYETKKQMLQRAKRLFLRGRSYVLRALDQQHPGFSELLQAKEVETALAMTGSEDIAYLYWYAASWMLAFSADSFDLSLLINLSEPAACMARVLELDETYANGAAHDVFISYYGGLPESMGGSEERARYHFQRSVEISGGESTAPYLSLATAVSVANQDVEEFRTLLEKVLSIDVEADPDNRLANILSQRKARWLLDHIEFYFLLPEEDGEEG